MQNSNLLQKCHVQTLAKKNEAMYKISNKMNKNLENRVKFI